MESLYASCTAKGNLADSTFNFMKDELTVKDSNEIKEKILTQPAFVPANVAVTDILFFRVMTFCKYNISNWKLFISFFFFFFLI